LELPLCRWPIFPGSAVFPRWTLLKTVRFSAYPLLELRFRLGRRPVPPSFAMRWAPAKLLSWALAPLQHMQPRRSTDRGLCLPATFHPQGLVTLTMACSLQGLAGFVSHRQRSWEVPFGAFPSQEDVRAFPNGPTHLPFYPAVSPPHECAGPARWVAVPEFCLLRVPCGCIWV
jgi:hypothetical protein